MLRCMRRVDIPLLTPPIFTPVSSPHRIPLHSPAPPQAIDQYIGVLKSDHSNVYAANGLGAVLAELGRLEEAKAIFNEVRREGTVRV